MKVWNKEANSCSECICKNTHDFDGSPYCNLTFEDVKNNSIHKDCPFAQKITKELVEGFGFIKLPEYLSCSNGAYLLETDKLFFPYSRGYKINYLIESHSDNTFIIFKFRYIDNVCYEDLVAGSISIFMGKINNPQELSFILRSIGVIE